MVVLITYLLQYEAVWRNISCLTRAAAFAVRENSGKILLNVYNRIKSTIVGFHSREVISKDIDS